MCRGNRLFPQHFNYLYNNSDRCSVLLSLGYLIVGRYLEALACLLNDLASHGLLPKTFLASTSREMWYFRGIKRCI